MKKYIIMDIKWKIHFYQVMMAKKLTKSLNWLTDIVMPNEYFKITHA